MSKDTIGPQIKRFRKKRNLTQAELAKALGYSHKSVITHIEKGESEMSFEKMLLLLRTYAADANELFDVARLDELIEERKNMPRHTKVVIYIHGLHGSADETRDFSYLNNEYDIKGLDYQDGNPWELSDTIKKQFAKLIKPYKEVVVIANSIGAFYAYECLSEFDIKHAFFISPIADMHQIIYNLMMSNGIRSDELKEKKIIKLDNGQTLSYDFYQHVLNDKDNWKVPTDILYGSRDELVYIENIADFLAAHPSAKLTIKQGAEHYFHTEEEKEFIKNWILNVIEALH